MQLSYRVVTVVLAIVMVAGGVLALTHARRLKREMAMQEARFAHAEERAKSLQATLDGLQGSIRDMQQLVLTWSNRVTQAQSQLAEERNTHIPLRQQIERMMQQEIVYKSVIERKDRQIKGTDEAVANTKSDLEAARSIATAHAQRIEQLDAELKARAGEQARAKQALDQVNAALLALRAELEQAKAALRDSERSTDVPKGGTTAPVSVPSATNVQAR